jgi:hypothetical protein
VNAKLLLPALAVALGVACGDGPLPPSGVVNSGKIAVSVVTVGVDQDNEYAIQVDDDPPRSTPASGVTVFHGLRGGEHTVRLSDVAPNCAVAGGGERGVQVLIGQPALQTAQVDFEVTCVKTDKIAFVRWVVSYYYSGTIPAIVVEAVDGSTSVIPVYGQSPSWSPDGTRLVYTSFTDYYGTSGGLFVVNADDDPPHPTRLTSNALDDHAAWSPDGEAIVFVRNRSLFRINRDGGGQAPFLADSPVVWASDPAWSHDGSRVAFTCGVIETNRDICVANADGTGFERLTNGDEADMQPAWRPDGAAIAFVTSRFSGTDIAVMNADGSGATRVTSGVYPSWTPDGSRLLFAAGECQSFGDCSPLGIAIIQPDGTGSIKLTTGPDQQPVWRP